MSEEKSEAPSTFQEAVRSGTPFYIQGGDPEDPNDPLNNQPMNIPAVVYNHLRAVEGGDQDRMRTFTIRIEESDHLRLVLLADALGTSKTTLARELLQMATREAIASLPEDLREDLRRKFLDEVS